MVVGIVHLELHIPYSHSLKEKRSLLQRIKQRISSRCDTAVVEVDFQDLWQRAKLGIVLLSSDKKRGDQLYQKTVDEIENILGGEALRWDVDWLQVNG